MSLSLSRKMLGAFQRGPWSNATDNQSCMERNRAKSRIQAKRSIGEIGMIDCFGLSDIGKVRERNEDQFLIADMAKSIAMLHTLSSPVDDATMQDLLNANLLLVADGVGGHAGGQQASKFAMEGVVEYLHNNPMRLIGSEESREKQICEDLRSSLDWAQQRIHMEAELSPELMRMGTTLTLAYVDWPTAYVAHVGDSRAYIYGGHELLQLTHDQTVAQMLADAGAIEPDRVDTHPFRNMLGSLLCCERNQLTPCVYQRRLMPGDQILLCTDGLTKHVSAQRIAEILDDTYCAADACHDLVAAANSAGGTDNVTVVLARFGRRLADTTEDAAIGRDATTVFRLERAMACSV